MLNVSSFLRLKCVVVAAALAMGIAYVVQAETDLPEDYRRMSWIASTGSGSQYIDTGVLGTPQTGLRMRFRNQLAPISKVQALFGQAHNYGNTFAVIMNGAAAQFYGYSANRTIPDVAIKAQTDYTLCVTNGYVELAEKNGAIGLTSASSFATFTENINIFNFAAENYPSRIRLYELQIWDGEGPVRDFIPCVAPSGKAGLWDRVTGAFFGNAGNGANFDYGTDEDSILPTDYEPMAWIESTGGQRIDTGIGPASKVGLRMRFRNMSPAASGIKPIVCSGHNWGKTYAVNMNGSSMNCYGYNGSPAIPNVTVKDRTCYTLSVINGEGVTVTEEGGATGNIARTILSDGNTDGGNLNLFRFANENMAGSAIRLYEMQMWEGETLVRDFIPCQDPTGKAGLWDKVTCCFFGDAQSASSGLLCGGGDVDPRPDYKYAGWIESTGTQRLDTGVLGSAQLGLKMNFRNLATPANKVQAIVAQKRNYGGTYCVNMYGSNLQFYGYSAATTVPGVSIKAQAEYALCVTNGYFELTEVGGATGRRTTTTSYGAYRENINLFNFAEENYPSKIRLYDMEMWNEDGRMRQFIPCIDPNGKVGLWDRSSGSFFGNAVSGADFLYGGFIYSINRQGKLIAYEGDLEAKFLEDRMRMEKAGEGIVKVDGLTSLPSLSVSEGTLSFTNGTVEEIAVAGTAKVKGGAVLGLDVNLNDRCDTIVADSIDLSEASAENPIVLNLNVVRKGMQGRLLFMTSSTLSAGDAEKFVISGVDSECWSVRYNDGHLYVAPYRSFIIIVR